MTTDWATAAVGEIRVITYAWGMARRSRVVHAWLKSGGTVCRAGGGEGIRFDGFPAGVARCSLCASILERGLRIDPGGA